MVFHAAVLALLATCSVVSGQVSAKYGVQFSAAAPGKAQGAVLVLDVGSLWKKHPTQPQLSIIDPGACQQRCSNLPGCTAYAFCKDPKGCGTGCSAHVAKNPSVSAVALESNTVPNKRGERVEVSSGFKIPITSFGPYHPTKGCDAKVADKWAFGTCTLLKGATGGKVAAAAESAGWVSGWLQAPMPPQCGPLSAAACAACFATPNADACLACATDKRATSYVVNVALIADGSPENSTGSRTLDQCVTCARLGDKGQQKQCVGCVLDNKPCDSCVPYPGAATQLPLPAVGPCMGCVEAKGKRFAGACLTCSATKAPSTCITCLDSFYPKLTCRTSAYEDCYKPDFDNPCASCQRVAPSAYDRCIACYGRPTSRADCDNCALVAAPAGQQQCFACSAKMLGGANGIAPGGCGACFARSKDPATLASCLSCVTGANTASPLRQHCSLCASQELTGAQSGRCFRCLAGKAGGAGCATCARSTTGDAAMAACMACRNDPANGPDCRDCDSLGWGAPEAAAEPLRQRCYECVTSSKLVVPPDAGSAPLGTCQACLSVKGLDAAACVACNTSPQVPTVAKGWCTSCAAKADKGQRDACYKCLASNAKLTTAAAFKQQCGL